MAKKNTDTTDKKVTKKPSAKTTTTKQKVEKVLDVKEEVAVNDILESVNEKHELVSDFTTESGESNIKIDATETIDTTTKAKEEKLIEVDIVEKVADTVNETKIEEPSVARKEQSIKYDPMATDVFELQPLRPNSKTPMFGKPRKKVMLRFEE